MAEIDGRIATYDRRIREIFRASEQCLRLRKIEGIGPVTATALIAAVGDRTCFKTIRACRGSPASFSLDVRVPDDLLVFYHFRLDVFRKIIRG